MRAYTWADLFALVRETVEVDSLDLPDTLLTPWFVEAFNEMEASNTRWTFRWAAYEYTWVGGTSAVDTWKIDNALALNVRDRYFDVIEGVYHPIWGRLQNVGYEELVTAKAITRETSGVPRVWSQQPNGITQGESVYKLNVWPTPVADTVLTIFGYRRPIDTLATSAGNYPDFPVDFHLALAWYALHLYYLQTEDTEMAGAYLQRFADCAKKYGERQDQLLHPFPVVLNGNKAVPHSPYAQYQYAVPR